MSILYQSWKRVSCAECGQEFEPRAEHHIYCHPRCRLRAFRKRERRLPHPGYAYGRATWAYEPLHLTRKQEYGELYLRPGAPAEVIDAAYRALSRLYHPDHAPAPAGPEEIRERERKMARLNRAYEWLRRGIRKKGGFFGVVDDETGLFEPGELE
jgi:DNA-directed RNA polymerase subunit RPC12/RpoP